MTTANYSTSVWDAKSGARMFHGEGSVQATFSPDGQRLVAAGFGKSKLWDAESGGEIADLGVHDTVYVNAVFDPAGSRVATASDDGFIRVFEVFSNTQDLIDHARGIVPRQLTPCERERFFLPVEGDSSACLE